MVKNLKPNSFDASINSGIFFHSLASYLIKRNCTIFRIGTTDKKTEDMAMEDGIWKIHWNWIEYVKWKLETDADRAARKHNRIIEDNKIKSYILLNYLFCLTHILSDLKDAFSNAFANIDCTYGVTRKINFYNFGSIYLFRKTFSSFLY